MVLCSQTVPSLKLQTKRPSDSKSKNWLWELWHFVINTTQSDTTPTNIVRVLWLSAPITWTLWCNSTAFSVSLTLNTIDSGIFLYFQLPYSRHKVIKLTNRSHTLRIIRAFSILRSSEGKPCPFQMSCSLSVLINLLKLNCCTPVIDRLDINRQVVRRSETKRIVTSK